MCQRYIDSMAAIPTEYSEDPLKRQELERKKEQIRSLMRAKNKDISFKSDRKE